MSMTIDNTTSSYASSQVSNNASSAKASTAAAAKTDDTAVVYEKSQKTTKDSANTIYNKDAIVKKLKADQQSRLTSMQSMVEKLLNKQAGTFNLASSTNLADTFRQAASLASADDIAKAKADVAEDGYWGVNQTSDRLVSMAIALSGGDTSKADTMKDAITKGFKQAMGAWGEDLPQISKDTYNAALKKLDDWKNGVTTAEDYASYLS